MRVRVHAYVLMKGMEAKTLPNVVPMWRVGAKCCMRPPPSSTVLPYRQHTSPKNCQKNVPYLDADMYVSQNPRLSRGEGTYALVVAPTRELCLQIQDVATSLLRKYFWLVSERGYIHLARPIPQCNSPTALCSPLCRSVCLPARLPACIVDIASGTPRPPHPTPPRRSAAW